MIGWIARILRSRQDDRPRSRLSQEEALDAARSYAAGDSGADGLLWATLVERDGRRVWVVSQSAIGSVLSVEIDDETGSLIRKGRIGIR